MKQDTNFDRQIRKKLLNAEVQAPEFEQLLKETLSEDGSLRAALSQKLSQYQADAPEFDALFEGELLGVPPAKTLKSPFRSPWFSITLTAAACLAVAFLLPFMRNGGSEKAPVLTAVQHTQSTVTGTESNTAEPTNQKTSGSLRLSTTQSLAQLNPEQTTETTHSVIEKNDEVYSEIQHETSKDSAKPSITQSIPGEGSKLGLENLSIKRMKSERTPTSFQRRKVKSNRISLGANLNGSNRLLSMVNSKGNSGNDIYTVINKTGTTYEGIYTSFGANERSAQVAKNSWSDVENLTSAQLQRFETNYQLPVNIGLTVSLPLKANINLITGIEYTYIANKISNATFQLKQELHYLGIPVKLSMNLIKRNQFTAYLITGGTIEKGLSAVQTSDVYGQDIWEGKQSVDGLAFSLAGGLGASYDLGSNLQLCLEPGVSWYAPTNQPICYRTEQPFNFSFNFGLRYRFQ